LPLELVEGSAPDPEPPAAIPAVAVDVAVLLAPLVSGLDEDADEVVAVELLVVISTGAAAPPAGDDTSVMLLLLTVPCLKSLRAKWGAAPPPPTPPVSPPTIFSDPSGSLCLVSQAPNPAASADLARPRIIYPAANECQFVYVHWVGP